MAKLKSNSVISTEYNPLLNTLAFTVLGAGTTTLKLDAVNEAIRNQAFVHGMKQRVSDAAAIARDKATGLSATPEEKLAAMAILVEHYNSGSADWNMKRSAVETGGLLLRALMECFPNRKADSLREYVKGLKPAEKTALMESDMIKPIVDRMVQAATAHVDTAAMIEWLGQGESEGEDEAEAGE